MATIGIGFTLSANAAKMAGGVNEAVKQLDKIGDAAKKVSRDVSALKTLAIGSVVAKGIGMAANAFTSAASTAFNYASSVASSVDAMSDLSARIGIGVESLQVFDMAAKLAGVENGAAALQKLTTVIGQAAESGNTEAFTKLGLDFEQLQAMSPEEQFRAIQQAISALSTPTERAAAAVSLFGKSGVELLPLMNQNLAEVEERMRRLGAVVGADQVEAIGSMNDALDMVKATFEGIVGQVVGNLAPVVESLANDFLAFVEEWNNIGGEGGTIADTISNALLDVADYFAGVFDNAMAGFDGFGVTLSEVGAVFEFVGNIFTAVSETIRAGFNLFQISGNVLAMGLGKFLEGIGSWVSSDLEKFGKDLTANAKAQADQNSREMEGAASNAATAAGRAIFGGNAAQGGEGPASRAVANARNRMNDPEAKAERERERAQKEADAKAAREAAAAKAKAEKDAADAKKRQDEAAKKAADIDEKMVDKQGQIAEIEAGKSAALNGKSNEALKANDIRSSEGMAQFIALATGREDPAIEENRKANAKLEEIRKELRALQQEKVDILGAAA